MKTSFTPSAASSDRTRSITGRPPTGSMGFGISAVSACRRVPLPAASTTAFTQNALFHIGDRPLDTIPKANTWGPPELALVADVCQRDFGLSRKVVPILRPETRPEQGLDFEEDLVD